MTLRFDRRFFLKGSGGALLGGSIFPQALSQLALAQERAKNDLTLVVFFTANGNCQDFFPNDQELENKTGQDGTPKTSDRNVARDGKVKLYSLRDEYSGRDVSEVFTQKNWGSLLDKLTILRGIDATYRSSHVNGLPLTGYAPDEVSGTAGPKVSIDQCIARHIQSPVLSINCGPQRTANEGQAISFAQTSAGVVPVIPEYDPDTVLSKLFKNVRSDDKGLASFEAQKRRNMESIDHVISLASKNRHFAAKKIDFESYLDQLNDFRKTIEQRSVLRCEKPSLLGEQGPEAPEEGLRRYRDSLHNRFSLSRAKDHLKIVAHAIKCRLPPRIFIVNLKPGGAGGFHKYINYKYGSHDCGHRYLVPKGTGGYDAAGRDDYVKIAEFQGRMIADFVKDLDQVEDGSGRTCLDRTVVLWTNNMGTHSNHQGSGMPIVMCGGKNGIRNGHLIDFRSPYRFDDLGFPGRSGVAYNLLLNTILHLFGVRVEDCEQEKGKVGIGTYEIYNRHNGREFQPRYAWEWKDPAYSYKQYAWHDKLSPLHELLDG